MAYRKYENFERTNIVYPSEDDIPEGSDCMVAVPNPKNGRDCIVSKAIGWAYYYEEEGEEVA